MNSTIERLLTLHVRDVMSREVVSVSGTKKMPEAADILMSHFISGAPVTDEHGQCVGMLSATDFVRCLADSKDSALNSGEGNGISRDRELRASPAADQVVSHMSALAQTVRADQMLTEAARMMCQNHVHRLVILDAQRRPTGVLTALDIVAAVIGAIEE